MSIDSPTHLRRWQGVRRTWGRWTYHPDRNLLSIPAYPNGNEYEIDLDECTSVGRINEWAIHLREKMWINSKDLGNLWCAFYDLFGTYSTFVHPLTGVAVTPPKGGAR